jgi:phosphatidylserine/phosphatidylglycerophosphate/cardiolipin synthase-like enzyme/uncharacterized membrane protein YdjX (TVP38/TMEM64 family)
MARAPRVSFLVDGASYYSALSSSLAAAQRSILILAWDIDSRVLLPHPSGRGAVSLVELLNELAAERPALRVHLLSWDFSAFFLLEREFLPIFRFGWRAHRHIDFHLDDTHPPWASHHQKVVVIDDTTAFSGGLDITTRRWDTPAHRAGDHRRRDIDGEPYEPFHDVQIAVEGPAAAALGDLARERWRRATGERLQVVQERHGAWPGALAPDLIDVDVAIARTEPAHRGRPEVREVEALFLDCIAAARDALYFENQYLSSPRIAAALARRLEEPDGPEVVIVCPMTCSGWLEQRTMGRLRGRFLRALEGADRHGRLRVYYPKVAAGEAVFVHSKVLVVDDRLVRIGSANLSNRSMAVDTECDLAIEATGDGARTRAAVLALRDRLLGEHLGTTPSRVAEATRHARSLVGAIESLRGGERTLEPILAAHGLDDAPPIVELVDPERPLEADAVLAAFLPEEQRPPSRAPLVGWAGVLAALLGLAAVWRFTALGDWIAPNELSARIVELRGSALAPLVVVVGYAVLGLCMVPLNALILATVMAFGPVLGPTYALLGGVASSGVGYGIGRTLSRRFLRRFARGRIRELSKSLARRGVLAVVTARIVPVAPFTLVNLAAGASRLRARSFFVGSALGMLPGIALLTVVGRQIMAALNGETLADAALPIAIGLLILAAAAWIGTSLQRRT